MESLRTMIMNDEQVELNVPRWVSLLLVVAVIITVGAAGFIYTGVLVSGLTLGSAVVALALWLTLTYTRPARRAMLPHYIAAIIAVLVLYVEQYYFGYAQKMTVLFPGIFSQPVVFTEKIFLSVFPFAGTVLFLFGGFCLFFHRPIGNYLLWLLYCLGIVSGVSVYIVNVFATGGYGYLPGMWTAPLAVVAGARGIWFLLRGGRMEKERAGVG